MCVCVCVCEQADPERDFATAAVLSECGDTGLPLLLSMLRGGTPAHHPPATPPTTPPTPALWLSAQPRASSMQATRLLLLRLLHTVCQRRKGRQHLIELGAINLLVSQVHESMGVLLGRDAAAAGGAAEEGSQLPVDSQLAELRGCGWLGGWRQPHGHGWECSAGTSPVPATVSAAMPQVKLLLVHNLGKPGTMRQTCMGMSVRLFV